MVRIGNVTVANAHVIQVFGTSGNDNLSLIETNGTLLRANLYGGPATTFSQALEAMI